MIRPFVQAQAWGFMVRGKALEGLGQSHTKPVPTVQAEAPGLTPVIPRFWVCLRYGSGPPKAVPVKRTGEQGAGGAARTHGDSCGQASG